MSVVDPNLLQLVGLGTSGDPYLGDGRHLRWLIGRLLGFPRSGFRLRRRRSPLAWTNDPAVAAAGRRQLLTQAALSGPRTPGLRLEKRGGLTFWTVFAGDSPALRVDAEPVWLDFVTDLLPEREAAEPAAYVLLSVARRQFSGRVVATAWYDTRRFGAQRYRFLDRAAIGRLLPFPGDLGDADASLLRGNARLRSRAEAGTPERDLEVREATARADLLRAGLRLRPLPLPLAERTRNPWVVETLLLHGGLIDRVQVTGQDAALLEVQWLPVQDYANAPVWEEVGRYFLPLTDAPAIYPAWSPEPGESIAKQRLMDLPPRAEAPWDEPLHPPPSPAPGTPERAALDARIFDDLAARHLGEEFAGVDEAMRLFLAGEVLQVVPQALVEVEQELEPDPPSETGPPTRLRLSPFDMLYAAAMDPAKARLLGLLTTDLADPDGAWDYVVDAAFPALWVRWTWDPRGAAAVAEVIRAALGGRPLPWSVPGTTTAPAGGPIKPLPVLSMATAIERHAAPPPRAPEDLGFDLVPRPLGRPVQADAALSWRAHAGSLFDPPGDAPIAFAVRRRAGGEDVPVHHVDPDTGRAAPHLPTAEAVFRHGGRCRVVDAALADYGPHEWRGSAMDLWGRFSPFAKVAGEVIDTVAPPVPRGVRAALTGETGPAWSLVVEWEWSAEEVVLTPDLEGFEVHLRQGRVAAADAQSPATWGRFEHTAGSLEPPLRVRWSAGTVDPPGPGLAADVALAIEGDLTRLRLDVAPVHRPFDADGFATVSVAVVAVDEAGNRSPFGGPAIALRADPVVPAVEPLTGELVWASPPDARRRSRYRVALPPLGGGTVQVLRASEASLRLAAGLGAEIWDPLDVPHRVGLLKGAAAAHREVFTPDHPFPYDGTTPAHSVELSGADLGWTVVTLLPMGRTGIPAPWPADPDRFAVVAVPHPPDLPRPEVEEVRLGNGQVTLYLAPDPSGLTLEYRAYRARRREELDDLRRMRPVRSVPAGTPQLPVVDDGLYPDVDYWYRVVGVGAGGNRSAPTEPLRARPTSGEPPPPGEVLAVTRTLIDPAARAVAFRVPRRDYSVYLFRRAVGGVWAELARTPQTGEDGTLRLGDLAATPVAGGWSYQVVDSVPDAERQYRYFVRLIDPRDRVSDSPAVLEAS